MFEGLHQGQILCAAAASSSVIITGGESTVVCVWELRKELQDKGKVSMQLEQVSMPFTYMCGEGTGSSRTSIILFHYIKCHVWSVFVGCSCGVQC